MRAIKISLLCFLSVFAFKYITLTTFPELIESYEWISWVLFGVLNISVFGLWFAPAIVAFRSKQIRHRRLIIFLSLVLPIVGGFMCYFILKGEIKYQQET
ncbi:hypothetical protein CWO01_15965 [Vibrio splendidus]|nr:hypothetical protein CWO01_15965 [Vibrio splendidus]